MKIAIRDDDISAFTIPDELDRIWSNIGLPITYAVTPFMVQSEPGVYPGREFANPSTGSKEYPIRMNNDLIGYLRNQLSTGNVSLALHGCTHQFRIKNNGLVAEYDINDLSLLIDKTSLAKKELEELFSNKITVFCPPDNAISREGMQAIASNGITYLQRAFPLRYVDSPVTIPLIRQYMLRGVFKLFYHVVYSKPFFNGYLIESAPYLFKRYIPLDQMIKTFEVFYRYDLPFTIATHYWELKDIYMRTKLSRLLDYIQKKPNVVFCPLEDVFRNT